MIPDMREGWPVLETATMGLASILRGGCVNRGVV